LNHVKKGPKALPHQRNWRSWGSVKKYNSPLLLRLTTHVYLSKQIRFFKKKDYMLKIKLEDIPFNLDPWDCELDEDVIENITSGDYFIEYVKNNPKPFQITFAAFVNAKEYFLYAWDGEVLIAGNVEHGTLYEDFEEIPMEEYDEKWREITQSEEIPDELIEEMDWGLIYPENSTKDLNSIIQSIKKIENLNIVENEYPDKIKFIVETLDKKSCLKHCFWKKDEITILSISYFRTAKYEIATSDNDFPNFVLESIPEGDGKIDSIKINSIQNNILSYKELELFDEWFYETIFPEEFDNNEKSKIDQDIEEQGEDVLKKYGFNKLKTDMWMWGRIEIKNELNKTIKVLND